MISKGSPGNRGAFAVAAFAVSEVVSDVLGGGGQMAPEPVSGIEALMDAAWPAGDREESGGWVMRAASGVTQRANSVWPREPGSDAHGQIGRASCRERVL